MAIDDLPMPVVNFLNVIGVEWPYINEDSLCEFGRLVREFGQAVRTTHDDATATIHALGSSYQGAAYTQLRNRWTEMSATHVTELVDACGVVADACDAAAAYVVGQKVVAVGELVGMAATFFADQAAAVATAGLAEAAVPVIIAAAKKLGESLIQDLEQYLIGQLVEAAIKPLFAKVEQAMQGLQWQGGAGATVESAFQVDTAQMLAHAAAMHGHADTFAQHARNFAAQAAAISF
ncbi:MAG TPA: hypothetical protein VKV34_08590 [Thermoleophilia bacterium]|jgi:hypothetical protein|nr:hypothetical protein [Thermoleophilia bacterium]